MYVLTGKNKHLQPPAVEEQVVPEGEHESPGFAVALHWVCVLPGVLNAADEHVLTRALGTGTQNRALHDTGAAGGLPFSFPG